MLILALVGAWRWRHNPHCRLLVASAVVTLVGYVLVPVDQGHGWGYRYFHSAWMVLPLLAAGALARVPVGIQQGPAMVPTLLDRLPDDAGVRTYLVACALLTLTLGWGLRAVQVRDFVSARLAVTPAYTGTEHRVVIMDPNVGLDPTRDDPSLQGNVIYLQGRGPGPDAVMMGEHFPNMHRVFIDRRGSVWSAAPGASSRGP
jgi:hypothetical protein